MKFIRYYGAKECDNDLQPAIWEVPSFLGPLYLCHECKEKLNERKVSSSE